MSKSKPERGPKDIAHPQRKNASPNGWEVDRDAKPAADKPYDGHHLGRSAR